MPPDSPTAAPRTIADRARRAGAIALDAARAFRDDRQTHTAASLAYTSFLSIIPLVVLLLAIVDPLARALGVARPDEEILRLVLDYVAPESQAEVGDYVRQTYASLSGSAASLGLLGLGGFLVTSVLLYLNVEDALNDVWRTPRRRPLPVRIVYFWGVATLGPLLLLLSLSVVGGLPFLGALLGAPAARGLLQLALSVGVLTAMYLAFPMASVTVRSALAGGVVAGSLFEATKWGFGLYVEQATTYKSLYGALGAIPVFVVWTYMVWVIALYGAQVARAADARGRRPGKSAPPERVAAALAIESARAFLRGEGPLAASLAASRLGLAPEVVEAAAARLCAAGLLAPVAGDEPRVVPAKDPRSTSASEVLIAARDSAAADGLGGPGLARALASADEALRRGTEGMTLADLAGEAGGPDAGTRRRPSAGSGQGGDAAKE
ncbi:MAG: YihY/virulence factor BrkB family protein [Planctomycetales bacterium]|nr:YihY/virulence factor BrkB family protein [Planctomycetales bacterium]